MPRYVRTRGVSLEGTFNYSPTFSERNSYTVPNGTWDYISNTRKTTTQLADAQLIQNMSRNYYLSSELLARYDNTFGDHTIGVLLGYSAMEYQSWGFGVNKKGATDWTLHDASTYSEILSTSSTARAGWGLRSYFGRINWSFMDKYSSRPTSGPTVRPNSVSITATAGSLHSLQDGKSTRSRSWKTQEGGFHH